MRSLDKWRDDPGNPWTEATQCRQQAALFDFSFMSTVRVSGVGAQQLVNGFVSRDVSALPENCVFYCLRLSRKGYVKSDLTVWTLGGGAYEVMSGDSEDITELMSQQGPDCSIENTSDSHSVFAIQGPESLLRLAELCNVDRLTRLDYFQFCDVDVTNLPVRVARLGYTGERGFELIARRADAQALWHSLARVFPVAGFGALDTLRIEAGFILYCNECPIGAAPAEMGLSQFAVQNTDRDVSSGLKLVCFTAQRNELPVLWQHPVSHPAHPTRGQIAVTSACFSPLSQTILGLGYINSQDIATAEPLVDPLGEFEQIALCRRPLFDPSKRIARGHWSGEFRPVY
jgi:glycine cleavage system aminomethyltransferase T